MLWCKGECVQRRSLFCWSVSGEKCCRDCELNCCCCALLPSSPIPPRSNFLNHSNPRLGGAAGFRVKNLLKLSDTRSLDGNETLLTWIARQLAAADPPAPVLAAEVPHVASPRLRVAVDEAAGALAAVEAGLAAVTAELQRGDNDSGEAANGGSSSSSAALQAAAAELEAKLADAKVLLQRCRDGFDRLATYYRESAAALPSEQELWLQLQAFVDRFSAAQRAVAAERAAEEERLRRQSSGGIGGRSGRLSTPRPGAQAEGDASSSQPGANGAAAEGDRSAARQLQFRSPPPAETQAAAAAAAPPAASPSQPLLPGADASSRGGTA